MKNELLLIRNLKQEQTLGDLYVIGEGKDTRIKAKFKTLELPYLDNQKEISCIPADTYICKKRTSKKYGNHFYILNVHNRSWILIHFGNFKKDTCGCILVGDKHTDINSDGLVDVTNSKATLIKLDKLLLDEFIITIR